MPLDKLLGAFINIPASGCGVVEVNTRVRPDEGMQQASSRTNCAEQPGVSETLNRCDEATVEQTRQAMENIHQSTARVIGTHITSKGSKPGLGGTEHNKQLFAAQEMLAFWLS